MNTNLVLPPNQQQAVATEQHTFLDKETIIQCLNCVLSTPDEAVRKEAD